MLQETTQVFRRNRTNQCRWQPLLFSISHVYAWIWINLSGEIKAVHEITGVSMTTIIKGKKELQEGNLEQNRVRKSDGMG
jgi:hypothetical protein